MNRGALRRDVGVRLSLRAIAWLGYRLRLPREQLTQIDARCAGGGIQVAGGEGAGV
jgi:hypothetical protein